MGEEMRILSIHPCGTSRNFLHTTKSYDMGTSSFVLIQEEGVLRIFIALKKIHRLGRVLTRNLWVQWQAQ
jgi:hypothetical protein